MNTRKIAVPSKKPGGLHGKISSHFGHCEVYTLVEITNGEITNVTILENKPHQAGGCMRPVRLLQEHGVDSIAVAGIGAGPFKRFMGAGIKVFFADCGTCRDVQSALDAALDNRLPIMNQQQLCKGNGNCHQHGV